MKTLAVLGLLALCACPPTPAPPGPDSGDATAPAPTDAGQDSGSSVYELACSNLQSLGCVEGKAPACASSMKKAQEARQTDFDPPCLIAAKTKEAVRACGKRGVACP